MGACVGMLPSGCLDEWVEGNPLGKRMGGWRGGQERGGRRARDRERRGREGDEIGYVLM